MKSSRTFVSHSTAAGWAGCGCVGANVRVTTGASVGQCAARSRSGGGSVDWGHQQPHYTHSLYLLTSTHKIQAQDLIVI